MKLPWRLAHDDRLIGDYMSLNEAIEAREALCGLNCRDDYEILTAATVLSEPEKSLKNPAGTRGDGEARESTPWKQAHQRESETESTDSTDSRGGSHSLL